MIHLLMMFTAGQGCFAEEWLVKAIKEHLFSFSAEWAEVTGPCSCLNSILQPHYGCNWRCGRVTARSPQPGPCQMYSSVSLRFLYYYRNIKIQQEEWVFMCTFGISKNNTCLEQWWWHLPGHTTWPWLSWCRFHQLAVSKNIPAGANNRFQTENEHIDTGLCNAGQPASAEHLGMFTTPAVAGLPPWGRGRGW